MAGHDFESLFSDKRYRALKREERRLFDLLIEAGENKRRYIELELEYQNGLNSVASDVSKMESELIMTPEEIERKLGKLQETVNEHNAAIHSLREDLKKSKLRFRLGEFNEEEYSIGKDRYREKLVKMVEEREWIETGMAVVRKVKSNYEKIVQREKAKGPVGIDRRRDSPGRRREDNDGGQKPGEDPRDPLRSGAPIASKSREQEAASFSMDQTALLAEELVGSDPERLLVPALHVKSAEGWERYPLQSREVSIGNIRNPENDIALYDPQVSRRHAKIIRDSVTDEWYFIDGGSTNGSTINNSEADPKNPVRLSNRDVICLGDTRIVLYLP